MLIILYVIGTILLILLAGKMYLSFQFNKEVKQLFSLSKNISDKVYHQEQLKDLPEPVQRYFNHVLKYGQPYISFARIKHIGKFKAGLDKDWINITGEQYATTQNPGFIWKGTTSTFVARDMYIANKGNLIVSLFSLYNVVDVKGEQYNQGELLRWLGESILYPTNFLPDNKLSWIPIDNSKAKLIFKYAGLELYFLATFNETGEITELETKGYMDEKTLATWIIKISEYKELNNIVVPTSFDVLWRLETGDFSYARFKITDIEYNIPELF